MSQRNKNCSGCNDYVTSDYVVYTGSADNCANIRNKSRITDVISSLLTFIKSKVTRIRSNSLVVTNESSTCEKILRIELIPSSESGNQLSLGADGRPYVPYTGLTIEQIENSPLQFKKDVSFDKPIVASGITSSGDVVAPNFYIDREGVQTLIPVFRQMYTANDAYYFNDIVSYNGKLYYHFNPQTSTGIAPTDANYWTVAVESGTSDGSGEPGQPGTSPDYTELRFAKNSSTTNPPSLVVTNPNPTGWTKTAPAIGTGEYLWFTSAFKKGSDGSLITNWSAPIRLTAKDGTNGGPGTPGEPGEDGSDIEMRFAKNGSTVMYPTIDVNATNPPGWTIDPPQIGDAEYVWMSKATKKGGVLVGQWSTPVRFTGTGGGGGGTSTEPFKSIVFIRSATQPTTPTGGSHASPVPAGWSDSIPAGTDIIWTSSRWFTKDGSPPQTANWTTPYALTNSSTLEIQYSSIATNPGTPATIPSYWHTTAQTGDIWMAQRIVNNGIPGAWNVMRFRGEDGTGGGGLTPNNAFKSFVFQRANTQPPPPTGGSYTSPVPSGWSDGVPAGEAILWMSSRIFTENGNPPQTAAWTTPQQMTSTATFRVKFSHVKTAPGTPATQPANWHDGSDVDDWWMAWLFIENGVASPWNVVKIRGEDGQDGTGGGSEPGPPGPFVSFRGVYDPFKLYYGSSDRLEIVQYPDSNGSYYISRVDAGGTIPSGTAPTNTVYWNPFAYQFESVATGLLFAKMAYIKNLGVTFLRTGPATASCNGDLPGTPTTQSAEHIEIYPSYSQLDDFRGQGDPGYVGLADSDLRNLANTIIFYSTADCGRRTKAHVDNVQLLKIQAVDARVIPPSTILNPDGTSTTVPGYTVPASSIIYQRIVEGANVRESVVSPAFIDLKFNGSSKIFLDPNGTSKFENSLSVNGTFNANNVVTGGILVTGTGGRLASNSASYTGQGGGIYASLRKGMLPIAKYSIAGTTATISSGGIFTVPNGIQFVQLQYDMYSGISSLEPAGAFEIIIVNQTTSQVTVTTNGDPTHNIYENGTFKATQLLGGRRVSRYAVMHIPPGGGGPGGTTEYYYTDNT